MLAGTLVLSPVPVVSSLYFGGIVLQTFFSIFFSIFFYSFSMAGELGASLRAVLGSHVLYPGAGGTCRAPPAARQELLLFAAGDGEPGA